MKKIGLLGDSIRMNYGTRVPNDLVGKYEVWQPQDNCAFSMYTLCRLTGWIQEGLGDCDVIHWNNGLWDTCVRFKEDGCFTPLEEYVRNMKRIARELLKITPKVIFATITPVAEGKDDQDNAKIAEYNARIVPELQAMGIQINDLHAIVASDPDAYICEDRIHLTNAGKAVCAVAVEKAIEQALGEGPKAENPLKVLAIGNSFSQDGTRWLHQIAEADGYELEVTELCIGGCSLERHWKSAVDSLPDYMLTVNGVWGGQKVTSKEILQSQKWDLVTLQQVSGNSGLYETYQPYLTNVANFVRENAPGAKLWIHETWAYETESTHGDFPKYDCDQRKMYAALKAAYTQAAGETNAEGMIPSGDVIQTLRDTVPEFDFANGGLSLNRDGFHLSHLYGRYAAAATWFRKLTGRAVSGNTFLPAYDGETADAALIAKIQAVVDAMV